jgi:predicted histone-like DNA-binding protein
MKYKLIQRSNPQDRTQSKWYAIPVNDGRITKTEISKELSALSSISRGDVSSIVENLIETLPKYLLMGKTVSLGEFGSLRLSFSSEGVDTPADFSTSKISGVKVIFSPGVEFKNTLRDLKVEKAE